MTTKKSTSKNTRQTKSTQGRKTEDKSNVDPAAHSGTLETSDPDHPEDADDVSAAVQEGLVQPGTAHEPGPGEQIVTVDGNPHTVPVESVDAVVEQARRDRGDENIQRAVDESRKDDKAKD